ncbi:GNAT family N-acetyltransferase [Marinobacterium jannaschii]|uniref:GNAT family N-acetyltransferase n=1 Tax=Marinobacterium jannaschii TaxID=64970 RepID=UPI000685EA6B|nr:GNAT family N-acetyltransferase [Marinobacterium jannaschii]
MECRPVSFPRDQQQLADLITEYVDWLGIDLSYQSFELEMASLDSIFTLPHGQFFFVEVNTVVAGGVGFRAIDSQTAEVKRFYVRKQFRGKGLGVKLMDTLLQKTRSLGFRRVVLDAVPPTQRAQQLYQSLGFYEIDPYFDNPVEGTRFYALDISGACAFIGPGACGRKSHGIE